MTRWSLFLQTLSLLHHFLGLYYYNCPEEASRNEEDISRGGGAMTEQRLEKVGAVGGVLFVVLQIVGQSLILVGGSEPAFDASVAEIVDFFEARDSALFNTGSYLSTLSVIPMLAFLASLRSVMRRAEGEGGWLTFATTGAGLIVLALIAGGGFWHLAVFRNEGLDPQIARLLFDLGNFNFATIWVVLGALAMSVGVATIWHQVFPKWLGWSGLVIGVGLIAARIFWTTQAAFAPYVLFWV